LHCWEKRIGRAFFASIQLAVRARPARRCIVGTLALFAGIENAVAAYVDVLDNLLSAAHGVELQLDVRAHLLFAVPRVELKDTPVPAVCIVHNASSSSCPLFKRMGRTKVVANLVGEHNPG